MDAVAGNPASVARGQERDDISEVVGLGEPFERLQTEHVIAPHIRLSKARHFRCDDPGRDSVHPNAMLAECGGEVKLYLRAKLGSCNCTTGVADDADLDRMSDFDLVGGEVSPLGAGRPITIAWMKGRSRAYTLVARDRPRKSAISIVFNDRCDMIVATVVLPHDRPAAIEPGVVAFLNSKPVVHWAELALGI